MSDEESPAPVFWGRGRNAIRPPKIPALMRLSTYLHAIGDEQPAEIKYIAQKQGLDPESRRSRQDKMLAEGKISDADIKQISVDDLRTINKALGLELVTSLTMYRLDSPVSCRANCELKYGWPRRYAPGGVPDVMVDYGNGCIVNVEVSAKERMDSEYFMDELTGSLKHMEKTQATWTLLVTGWGLENPHARECYEDFCRDNKKKLQERKILVMSVESLAQVSGRLAAEPKLLGRKNFSSRKDMVAIFRALEEAMDSGEQDLGKVWFDEAMERMQAESPSPEPDPEPGPGPGPGM